jgi:hypothetical protein
VLLAGLLQLLLKTQQAQQHMQLQTGLQVLAVAYVAAVLRCS